MIKVTVELVSAVTGKTTLLGTALICNDATGSYDRGNYCVDILKWSKGIWKTGHVSNFQRMKFGPWDLLYLALKDALGPTRLKRIEK